MSADGAATDGATPHAAAADAAVTGAATGADRPRTILVAPDSFKGSLTSVEVARALADGWARARPRDEIVLSPLADGGEGTLAAVEAAGGWQTETATVHDPLGRSTQARWLRSADGARAFIEMAEASGLSRVRPDERDPIGATSIGTGELIAAAASAGVSHITLGIGGSATTDGGRGLIAGLGDTGPVELAVACDVSNPLLGASGAAAIYGPQKGATPTQVIELDARNAAWADDLESREGRRVRDTPGAGAAGGVGFALLAIQDRFTSFALRPGVDLVMEATDFDAKLAARRSRDHRRGPHRRPDRVRQDRARRREARAGGGRPVHRRRWRRGARGHRGPGRRRRGRRSRLDPAASDRRGDGRRRRSPRALRGATGGLARVRLTSHG